MALSSTFTLLALVLIFAFIYFRQDGYIEKKHCRLDYVLQEIPFMTVPFIYFLLSTVIIVACHCIITFKLFRRAKLFGKSNTDDHSKLMRASWIVTSLYIVSYIPTVVVSLSTFFIGNSCNLYVLISQDICALIFFFNNVVNPFIYFLILKNFRVGYITFLTCGKRNEG